MAESGVCKIIAYADFNCPFSYALNERLHALNLEYRVDFRPIQHAPSANSNKTGFDLLMQLSTEVAEVRRRSPSTQVNLPMFRPNSAAALTLVAAVRKIDPDQAILLRRHIYRALWVDGQDISNSEILLRLLRDLDITQPDVDSELLDELSIWQKHWDTKRDFHHNIPILISDHGETVIGFPLQSELDSFLSTGSLVTDRILPTALEKEPLQRIMILDTDIKCVRTVIEQMCDTQVEIVPDFSSLITSAHNQGIPDLVLADTALIGDNRGTDWWRDIAGSDLDIAVPVIFVSGDKSTNAEVAAFEAGAFDFISKPLHPKILRARLKMHLLAKRSNQQLSNIARVDSLTSICNRREFDYRLMSEWGRAARADRSLALLMIDIDKFKEYNDYLGHLNGDDCLIRVAQILSECMQRSIDSIARYGGEEFVALLPEVDIEGAAKVAKYCLSAILDAKIPHAKSTVSPNVTISIGVAAVMPVYGNSSTLLIEQADIALYQAKKNGRNRICCFDYQF